jgi:hypothetical protein
LIYESLLLELDAEDESDGIWGVTAGSGAISFLWTGDEGRLLSLFY